MDLEMPDSLEATRAIRTAEAPGLHVPICALTAHALPTDRNTCVDAGFDGFIAKPILVDEVLQLVSKLAEGTANTSGKAYISEADASSSTEFGATRPAFKTESDDACTIAIDAVGKLVIADSDENVLREISQNAEIVTCLAGIEPSYNNSDDSGLAANAPLSAPAGLALLEASCQLTQQVASLVKQDDGPTPIAAWDPFGQARKSLSNSRFGVRVIHNDGDPSDRNLI
jgi:hypothetical protein